MLMAEMPILAGSAALRPMIEMPVLPEMPMAEMLAQRPAPALPTAKVAPKRKAPHAAMTTCVPTARFAGGSRTPTRWSLSSQQRRILEHAYRSCPYPVQNMREQLGRDLNVTPRQVQIWFQNRRQRTRREAESEKVDDEASISAELASAGLGCLPSLCASLAPAASFTTDEEEGQPTVGGARGPLRDQGPAEVATMQDREPGCISFATPLPLDVDWQPQCATCQAPMGAAPVAGAHMGLQPANTYSEPLAWGMNTAVSAGAASAYYCDTAISIGATPAYYCDSAVSVGTTPAYYCDTSTSVGAAPAYYCDTVPPNFHTCYVPTPSYAEPAQPPRQMQQAYVGHVMEGVSGGKCCADSGAAGCYGMILGNAHSLATPVCVPGCGASPACTDAGNTGDPLGAGGALCTQLSALCEPHEEYDLFEFENTWP